MGLNKEIYDNFSKKERLLRLKGYIKFNEVISPVYSYAHVLGIEKELKDADAKINHTTLKIIGGHL